MHDLVKAKGLPRKKRLYESYSIPTTAIICCYEAVPPPGIHSLALGPIPGNWTAIMGLIWLSILAAINSKSGKFLQDAHEFVVG